MYIHYIYDIQGRPAEFGNNCNDSNAINYHDNSNSNK